MASDNKTTPSLSIILPTYNERKNIEIFIPLLAQKFSNIPHEIIVVDDSSPDGTGEEVSKLARKIPNVALISRKEKSGIGNALRHGYNAAKNDIILSCDSDLSFSVDDVMKLYDKIVSENYDVIIGSRHSAASGYETPNFGIKLKYAVSRIGNKLLRALFRVPVRDFSVNCRAIRRSVWRSFTTKENGNFFLFEMIFLAQRAGARIGEVPVTFKDRQYGSSKINHVAEVPKAFLKMLVYLLRR
ncbi:MAG: hypothetical protein A3B25_02190 [Candidatus Ryanbacteria bacterium RIFCSPLOWO2_01_FULL_48_26]|uniref:Glycosyltransferase 2-like domain-containing protein n=1 Tax=Candidatus Ryanbacteria bacterium RIFCSPLOWO2_01_FULL_48_26 TaxID=1802126 RepID=A0A1G2GT63_9BACT|nr:MAG: hypothetical protein A3B25_02190 [Candidatus Ryanbacteria bacterium RIFCSPLOWO2_01_FULL_48_26]